MFCYLATCIEELMPKRGVKSDIYPTYKKDRKWLSEYRLANFPGMEVTPGSTSKGVRATQVLAESIALQKDTDQFDARDLLGAVADDSVAESTEMPLMPRAQVVSEVQGALINDEISSRG